MVQEIQWEYLDFRDGRIADICGQRDPELPGQGVTVPCLLDGAIRADRVINWGDCFDSDEWGGVAAVLCVGAWVV